MKKKSIMTLLALTLVSATVLAACGGKDVSKGETKGGSDAGTVGKQTEIHILTRFAGSDPKSKAFQDLLKKFMEKNPDVKVVDESLNDENAFNNKFKTGVATGNMPEIWMNYGGEAFKDYAKNIALDIEPYLKEDKAWSDAFLPLFDTWKYSDLQGIYGVPNEFYSVAIYYNKELFEKAGAKPPTTIEEVPALVDKFKPLGAVPMAMGEKENFRGGHLMNYLSMKKFGFQKTQDLVSRKAKWNDPDMVGLLQIMKDWQDKGVFGQNIVTLDNNATTAMFFSGKSAMLFEGVWAVSSMAASPIADKIGVIPFPYFQDKPEFKDTWFGGAGGYSIAKSAEAGKRDAAVKLVKYLTSVEAFQYYFEATKGGVYPVKMDMGTSKVDPVTTEYIKAQNSAKEFKAEIESYDPLAQLTDKTRNEIQGMFAGNKPQKAADAIQSFVDSNK